MSLFPAKMSKLGSGLFTRMQIGLIETTTGKQEQRQSHWEWTTSNSVERERE